MQDDNIGLEFLENIGEDEYLVLPLRDIVVFPERNFSMFVGREKSVKTLQYSFDEGAKVLFVTQKDGSVEDPLGSDLYDVGTVGQVLQMMQFSDNTRKILSKGQNRVKVKKIYEINGFLIAKVESFDE
jgi:ATP-dependent Lon protease